MKYEVIVGLEIHVQLKTKSKMFCRCSADIWTEPPNTHTCPVCLGLPGALPFPSQDAIEKTVKTGLALNCKPATESKFDRKNYFYPDLPKGFQISQYDLPFSEKGWVEIEETRKKIGIIRVHLEEDTGKLIHTKDGTLIDFNRSGIPLMEIVSAPDIATPQEAKNYAVKIQQIVRYLGVSDADMEKGSMRVEPNVSLRKISDRTKDLPPYKVELKNINSFRSVEKGIEYEIGRQAKLLDKGVEPVQETRGWDEIKLATYSQRTKEEAFDYRYFPEPDLPPFEISSGLVSDLRKTQPEMPNEKMYRYIKNYQLSVNDAQVLTRDINLAQFFEEAVKDFAQTKVEGTKAKPTRQDAVKIANWIKGEVLRNLNQLGRNISEVEITPADLAEIVYLAESGVITAQSAKLVLGKWMAAGAKPTALIESLKIKLLPKEELTKIVEKVVSKNQKAVKDYTGGRIQALSFLIGQVQKAAGGKLPANSIRTELLKHFKSPKN